ncbi:MAG: recombinase family protein [Terriglobales bacterium]
MGKVLAYARVSTPRQGEKGVSLTEQKSAIERYAEQHNLQIVRWFEERETAAKTGRHEFTTMLRLLRLKVADGVIIHKIDRSARNLKDWADLGKLVDAGADIHFATENLDLKTVAGRLSADIQAVVAAHYSRNLREEAKKGFYGRLKQGYYPLRAPVGYLDQGGAKPKVADPQRSQLVRQAFELYAAGNFSLPALATEMARRGLRNRSGGHVTVNGLATMLKNPFYIGLMKIDRTGETFRGNHDPLISTELFENVQATLTGKRADRTRIQLYTFSRIVRCASCNYSLIAERQKGHTYYRCHNRPFKTPAVCPPTSIREDQLDKAITAALADIDLSTEEVAAVRALVQERRQRSDQLRITTERALRLESDQIQNRLSKLADLIIEGTLERSLYQTKQQALLIEQAAVADKLQDLQREGGLALDRLERTVELAKSPSILYKAASLEQKRELLKTLLSNLAVSSKNVDITLSVPFRLIAGRRKNTECRANRGTCRTWEQIFTKLYSHFADPLAFRKERILS